MCNFIQSFRKSTLKQNPYIWSKTLLLAKTVYYNLLCAMLQKMLHEHKHLYLWQNSQLLIVVYINYIFFPYFSFWNTPFQSLFLEHLLGASYFRPEMQPIRPQYPRLAPSRWPIQGRRSCSPVISSRCTSARMHTNTQNDWSLKTKSIKK